ncbi:hypothetical protein GVAV_001254 [Gurleya vavrai]
MIEPKQKNQYENQNLKESISTTPKQSEKVSTKLLQVEEDIKVNLIGDNQVKEEVDIENFRAEYIKNLIKNSKMAVERKKQLLIDKSLIRDESKNKEGEIVETHAAKRRKICCYCKLWF